MGMVTRSFLGNRVKFTIVVFVVIFSLVLVRSMHRKSIPMFSKGQTIVDGSLVPEILPVSCGVKEIKSLPEKDRFVLINGRNEFAFAELNQGGDLKTDVIVPDYPNSETDGYWFEGLYSDDSGKILWTIQIRAILALNTVTKKKFSPLFAFGGNTSLVRTVMVDNEKEIILGEVLDLTGGGSDVSTVVLKQYDCINDKLSEPSKTFDGFLFYLGNKEHLWCETSDSNTSVKWHICDLELKNIRHNKLTDALTEKQISTWGSATPVCPQKRMMIAGNEGREKTLYFSVRWNADMSEVKIEPLILQIPQNGGLERGWFFSEDGNWLITTFWTFHPEEKQTLVFFHIDDKYPQGISLPVFGQETRYEKKGCFLNHSVHGPLYLDWSPGFANTLLVYRLSDVLKVLAEKVGVR